VARLEGASLIIVSSPDLYGRIEALCNHLKNITLIKWGQDSLENPPNHVITSLFKKTYKKFLKTNWDEDPYTFGSFTDSFFFIYIFSDMLYLFGLLLSN
jgi:hypothetical protein